jgi:serine/threonine protein kinase
MVRKRDEVVGGSARQGVVETLKRQRQRETCWKIPILGILFRVCLKPQNPSMRVNNKNLFQPTIDSTRSATSTYTTASSSPSVGSQKRSEIIHAMKTIHLSRIKDNTFVQELQNEIAILRTLDHPNIVRIHEMYSHQNQIFVIMDMCSGCVSIVICNYEHSLEWQKDTHLHDFSTESF